MATRKRTASADIDLHREIVALTTSLKYLADKVDVLSKQTAANAERIRWYDFWMKAGKVLAIATAALLTFKLGDVKSLIISTITK